MGVCVLGKFGWSYFIEGVMRVLVVVVFVECFEQFVGVEQVDEFVFVEVFVVKFVVEVFEVGVLGGFFWGDEMVCDVVFMVLVIQGEFGKFWVVVGEQILWVFLQVNQLVEYVGNVVVGQ